jgi:hypothetical protein
VDWLQPRHDPTRLQAVQDIIQQGAFVPPVHPIDDLCAVQPPREAVIVTAGDLPTQAFRQMLAHRFPGVRHGPPSALACRSAIEAREPSIQAFA